jgi:hypothetical protein
MLGLIVRDGKSSGVPELGYMNDKRFGHNVIQESEAGIQQSEEKQLFSLFLILTLDS